MAKKYDLQDPYDLEIMKAEFQGYSASDWESYIKYASHQDNHKYFSKFELEILSIMEKNAKNPNRLSSKQILAGLNVAHKIEELKIK